MGEVFEAGYEFGAGLDVEDVAWQFTAGGARHERFAPEAEVGFLLTTRSFSEYERNGLRQRRPAGLVDLFMAGRLRQLG
jgi:hypothetical protein